MRKASIQFVAAERLNTRFDEVFNCELDSRISDPWFLDQQKVLVRPRPGSEISGRLPAWVGTPKDITWFVDDDGNKSGYISRWGEVYKTPYATPGKYLGKFASFADASTLSPWMDGDYFIAHQTLYYYLSGSSLAEIYVWTDSYDNEADLYAVYPVPEDDLFTFLKDSQTVYYSSGGYWIPYGENYTFSALSLTNNPDAPATFNTVTLPATWQVDGTQTLDATVVDKVNVWALASPATYVGSYLIITSWTYKGKYGYILDYAANEFTIISLWNAVPIVSGVTFSIFSTKWRYLQITNWYDNDRYYNGSAFETRFAWYVKQHIAKFVDFPNGWPWLIRTYWNQCYTSVGDSVYISDVAQPLWYNINDSIDLQKSAAVDDFFVWKSRMIAYGNNFTTFINANVSAAADRTVDFKNYGIVPWSCAEVLDDFWFLTYSGQVVPLSITVYWDVIEKKNIGTAVYRYLKTMKRNVTACFDGRKYYIYGEEKNQIWYTCVYDTLYGFWAVYTGIRPVKFLVDNGEVYYTEYSTGNLRKLTKWKVTDAEVAEDQYISSKDIDGWQVFVMKALSEFWLFMENRNQDIKVNVSHRTNKDSYNKDYNFTVNEKRIDDLTPILWYNNIDNADLIPHFIHYPLSNDMANIWRWKMTNNGTNGFYLNQIELGFNFPDSTDITNVDL